MKPTLPIAALFLIQFLLGQRSFADCVGTGAAGSVSVQVKKFYPAYFRNQKIEGCLAEIIDMKTKKLSVGYSAYDFICEASETEVLEINILQHCCDSGDFPEPCGVTAKNLPPNVIKSKGVVFEPLKLDERSFEQIKRNLTSNDFFVKIRSLRDLKKISSRQAFRNELEMLLE